MTFLRKNPKNTNASISCPDLLLHLYGVGDVVCSHPMNYSTGSRSVICNAEKPSPVEAAKAQREAAEKQEEEVSAAQDMADGINNANDAGTTAKKATSTAMKAKPNTMGGRQAHAQAALAHQDAQKAHSAVAGNDDYELPVRAKAKQKAEQHGEMCKKHQQMSATGMMGGTMNTGSHGVVCNVTNGGPGSGRRPGGGGAMDASLHDRARVADYQQHASQARISAEADQATDDAFKKHTPESHDAAQDAHMNALDYGDPERHGEHGKTADSHGRIAEELRAGAAGHPLSRRTGSSV